MKIGGLVEKKCCNFVTKILSLKKGDDKNE
jgi:hypothetical protein